MILSLVSSYLQFHHGVGVDCPTTKESRIISEELDLLFALVNLTSTALHSKLGGEISHHTTHTASGGFRNAVKTIVVLPATVT
jgi:hypothetical protein